MVDCLNWLAKPWARHGGLDPRRPEPTSHRAVRTAGGSGGHCRPFWPATPIPEIDQRELQRGGPSYFVDTLRSFRAEDESTPLRFLIGADQALQFRRWHNWEQILDLAHPVIAAAAPRSAGPRTGARATGRRPVAAGWWRVGVGSAAG